MDGKGCNPSTWQSVFEIIGKYQLVKTSTPIINT